LLEERHQRLEKENVSSQHFAAQELESHISPANYCDNTGWSIDPGIIPFA